SLVRLRTQYTENCHRKIQLCDGTANFWDGAVYSSKRAQKFTTINKSVATFYLVAGLDSVADGALEVCAVVAAEGELLAVFHDDAVLTMKPRLHLFDPIDLHNRGTMNSTKLPRVELLFQTADRLAQQITFLVVVDPDVVSFRLDAVHVLHV